MLKSVSSEGAGAAHVASPLRTLTGPHWLWAPFLLRVVGHEAEGEGQGTVGSWGPASPPLWLPSSH